MVHFKSGIFKDANGTYKNMIIYQMRGETYGRKKPSYDGNAGSPTREVQNSRMTSVVTLFQSIKHTFLVNSWRSDALRNKISSGYNYFVKKNIKAFGDNYNVGDFTQLTLCVGTLQTPFGMKQQPSSARTCSLTWETAPWMLQRRGKDQLIAAVIYEDEPFRVEIITNTGATRQDGEATFSVDRSDVRNVHVYCFFANEDRDLFSESVYFNFHF
ncbi:DUF6266 family protein [Butyricimonas paravirosa]|uniref:DUF6266 family protein n=1 Tax=Butyricimonas paravirosa TaxID=1472417 RepID=UPI00210A845D|nr:DUF6266 family protein [Butyricimonas paravirosa]MCQ4874456.1 DUF6266 family protein [Butyricimonas paravirosa]